jgi:NMT1-like family
VMPMSTRLFFTFSKNPLPDSATVNELFANKKVGIELLNGEAQMNIEKFFERSKIEVAELVTFNDNPDVVVFWGTFYGTRATKYLQEGWHPFSFKSNWIEFLTLNDPALRPFTLPAIPGERKSIDLNTIATEAVLVANQDLGENAIYELAQVIFQHKLTLMNADLMYRSIDEAFEQRALLYPLHEGTVSYLRRDQPTFFERYANTIAPILSIVAVLYGAIQTIRNMVARRRKEQVDKYFLDFLEIRTDKAMPLDQKVKRLDGLFQRAVEQMTHEKLEKSDFHILSRLIQQELTMLKFHD